MPKQMMLLISFCLLTSVSALAQQDANPAPFTFKSGQSVYVVAVKHNSPMTRDLWVELNRSLPQNKNVVSRPATAGSADPTGRATLDRALSERPTLDSAEPSLPLNEPADETVKGKVSEALRQQKKFNVVDSIEQADLVLFVQGEYTSFFQQHTGNGGFIVMSKGNDSEADAASSKLVRLQMAAIPATAYRQAKKLLPDNAETVRWRGHIAGRVLPGAAFEDPSIEALVKQFQKDALK